MREIAGLLAFVVMPGARGFKAFKIRIKSLQIRQIINPVRSEAHGVTDKLAPDHAFDPALRGGIRHGKKQPKGYRTIHCFWGDAKCESMGDFSCCRSALTVAAKCLGDSRQNAK